MADTNQIAGLLEQVPGKTGAKALESLEPETREVLEDFEKWLTETDGKSESTAKAYKGYVAQAIVALADSKTWDELSTDVRSGVRAFVRYQGATSEADQAE